MTSPNNTVAGLAEKWRCRAGNIVASDEYNAGRKNTYEHCADQLEDALTPAPRTASVRVGFSAQGEPMCANVPTPAPSAPPSVAGGAGELPGLPVPWFCLAGAHPTYTADQMRAYGEQCRRLATAEQPGSAVQGER